MTRYPPDKGDQEEIRQLRKISTTLNNIHSDIHQLTEFVVSQPGRPTLGAFIKSIHGRKCNMAVNIAVPKLLDTEKIQLSVMPRKADGHVDAAAVVTWTASGAVVAEVGTEAFDFNDPQFSETVTCPGSFNCWALTPEATGTGSITASAPGYDSAEFGPIEWAAGVPLSLNGSAGSPVSDIPTTP